MPGGCPAPLLSYFEASVTWCLNACSACHIPDEKQLDGNDVGRRGWNTDFLILSFWGRCFALLYRAARRAIWDAASRRSGENWFGISWKEGCAVASRLGEGGYPCENGIEADEAGMAYMRTVWCQRAGHEKNHMLCLISAYVRQGTAWP